MSNNQKKSEFLALTPGATLFLHLKVGRHAPKARSAIERLRRPVACAPVRVAAAILHMTRVRLSFIRSTALVVPKDTHQYTGKYRSVEPEGRARHAVDALLRMQPDCRPRVQVRKPSCRVACTKVDEIQDACVRSTGNIDQLARRRASPRGFGTYRRSSPQH